MSSDLELALEANDTQRYLELQKEKGAWRDIPPQERSIEVYEGAQSEFVELRPGVEAPWCGPLGACLVRVYDIRRNEEGSIEFGLGNESLPILGYVKKEAFYTEWPN